MEEKEIWKDIEGFEGMYQVSNMGNVKSLKRTIWNSGKGCYRTVHERILKANKNNDGYLQVQLHQDGKRERYLVHRLVATAFLPNPDNLPQVNHIDENKENNCMDNLEWVTCKENANHGTRNKKISKPVIGIDMVTGLIVEFPSAKEAKSKLGIAQSHICHCLKGRQKSSGGFAWYYANNNDADTEE